MNVYGTAAGSLTARDGWTTSDRARQGRIGERDCAKALRDAFRADPDAYVFHDLNLPGYSANIDHVVVRGLNVLLIDAKRWRPGLYWTLPVAGGRTFRGSERIAWADKATLPAAARKVREMAAAASTSHAALADVTVSAAMLVFPSGAGAFSTALYRPAGDVAVKVATRGTSRWLRAQVAAGPGAPYGPLLRLVHQLVGDRSRAVMHGQADPARRAR